jgi:hypothetical protein
MRSIFYTMYYILHDDILFQLVTLRYLTRRGSDGFIHSKCIPYRELKLVTEFYGNTFGRWNNKTNLGQTYYEDFN